MQTEIDNHYNPTTRANVTHMTVRVFVSETSWSRFFAENRLVWLKSLKIRVQPDEPTESVKRRRLNPPNAPSPFSIEARDLERLSLGYFPVSGIEMTCPNLLRFSAHALQIEDLKISHPTLVRLSLKGSSISTLNISNCPALEYVDVVGCGLRKLTLDRTPNLVHLNCSQNTLSHLSLEQKKLETLNCQSNQLVDLNLVCSSLQILNCSQNQLKSWYLSCPELERLECHLNPLSKLSGLEWSTRLQEIFVPRSAWDVPSPEDHYPYPEHASYHCQITGKDLNRDRDLLSKIFFSELVTPPAVILKEMMPNLRIMTHDTRTDRFTLGCPSVPTEG